MARNALGVASSCDYAQIGQLYLPTAGEACRELETGRYVYWRGEAITNEPEAQAVLAELIDEPGPYCEPGDPTLAAAWTRLSELPIPQGEHSYLDEIRLALEAARASLTALAAVPHGDVRFREASARLPHTPP